MKIPELADNVKDFFQYIIRKSKFCEGMMYIGDYNGGYVFTPKLPKSFDGLFIGVPKFMYVKDDIVFAIDRSPDDLDAEDMYSEFFVMYCDVDEDTCYTITLDDKNK